MAGGCLNYSATRGMKSLNVWLSQSNSLLLLKGGILFPPSSPCFSSGVTSVETSVKAAMLSGGLLMALLSCHRQGVVKTREQFNNPEHHEEISLCLSIGLGGTDPFSL